MNVNRFIGRWPVRLAALTLGISSAASWLSYADSASGQASLFPRIALSVIAFVCIVHSGRRLYSIWMSVAEAIQMTVVTTLFSLIYLLFVPTVWVFARMRDSLKLRNGGESTYWVDRPDEERTAEFFERMG